MKEVWAVLGINRCILSIFSNEIAANKYKDFMNEPFEDGFILNCVVVKYNVDDEFEEGIL